MTRLHTETLEQLTTAFATAARAETRTRFEPSTIQLVYAALAELRDRRRLDDLIAAAVGVVDARAATEEARDLVRLAAFEAGPNCTGAARTGDGRPACYSFAGTSSDPCPACRPVFELLEGRRILSHHQKGAVRTLANTVARIRSDGVDLSVYRLAPRKGREDKRRARERRADGGARRLATTPKG